MKPKPEKPVRKPTRKAGYRRERREWRELVRLAARERAPDEAVTD